MPNDRLTMLIAPVGSAGDVHPFVGLGARLKERGHEVKVFTHEHFEPLVRDCGLDFLASGDAREYEELADNPDLWHPLKSLPMLARQAVLPKVRPTYEVIAKHYRPGRTLVVAQTVSFGARIAHDKLGVPLVTLHLQPSVFRSVHRASALGPLLMGDRVPKWIKRLQFAAADVLLADRVVAPTINELRAELGLPSVRRIFAEWFHSPQLVIGLFPEWFAPQQPDWPEQTRLTGFPMWDHRGATELPAEVGAFLSEGDPPIVFTPGSAMRHGRRFFEAAAWACDRLGQRGVFLTPHTPQVPRDLPSTIRHFDYVPLSLLLPSAAALVHHGGVGTVSQALAAAVPQLIMPMAYDQPDNAARVKRLGVGEALKPRSFRGPAVARALDRLLSCPTVAFHCEEVAARFDGEDPFDTICDLAENVMPRG